MLLGRLFKVSVARCVHFARLQEVIFSKTFEDAAKPICAGSFSPQFLAAGGNEGKVWIYDLHQDPGRIRAPWSQVRGW